MSKFLFPALHVKENLFFSCQPYNHLNRLVCPPLIAPKKISLIRVVAILWLPRNTWKQNLLEGMLHRKLVIKTKQDFLKKVQIIFDITPTGPQSNVWFDLSLTTHKYTYIILTTRQIIVKVNKIQSEWLRAILLMF